MTPLAAIQALGGLVCLALGAGLVWSPGAGLLAAGAVLLVLSVWPERRSR